MRLTLALCMFTDLTKDLYLSATVEIAFFFFFFLNQTDLNPAGQVTLITTHFSYISLISSLNQMFPANVFECRQIVLDKNHTFLFYVC